MFPVPVGILPVFSPTPTNPFRRARSMGALHCTHRPSPTSDIRASRRDLPRQTRNCMTTMRQTWPRPLDSATLAPHGRVPWPCRPAFPRCLRCQDASWTLATRARVWTSPECLEPTVLSLARFPGPSRTSYRYPTTHPSPTRSPMNVKSGRATRTAQRGRTATQMSTSGTVRRRTTMTTACLAEWRSNLPLHLFPLLNSCNSQL